jgi:2,3-bisphosphoglycerate-dependent phosphoglycerate mutase
VAYVILSDRQGALAAARHAVSTANEAFAAAAANGGEVTDLGYRHDADVPLAPAGWTQAEGLGRWARSYQPGVVYCSTYARAGQTWQGAASQLDPATRPRVIADARLRDRDMGDLELLGPAAIARRYPDEARISADLSDLGHRPPAGESYEDVLSRVCSILADVDYAERPLFVTHDAVVLMLLLATGCMPAAELARQPAVANASVTTWWAGPHRQLHLASYNDVRHLIPAASPRESATPTAAELELE